MANTMIKSRHLCALDQPSSYRIRSVGVLDSSWSDSMGGMKVVQERREDGEMTTELTGPLSDQAALMGVLNTLYDLGLSLMSVEQLR